MKINENSFTLILCEIDHRPESCRARRFYSLVQKYICEKNELGPVWARGEVSSDNFSDTEIEDIAQVLSKIRIMDSRIRDRLGKSL